MPSLLGNILDNDFRAAGRFCARNARVGVQSHPVAALAVVIAAHMGQAPLALTWATFLASLVIATWRWLAAQQILQATQFTQREWLWKVAIPAIIANLLWSTLTSATLILFGITSVTLLLLLASIALTFGCTTAFAPLRILALPLLVIHLGLPLLAALTLDGAPRVILAVLLLTFLLYILRIANSLHADYWSSQNTRNHLTEARLQAEQASLAKDQFLANISHEIRTPLNGITAPIELMRQTRLDDDQRHYVDLINSSSQTLMQLIDDLLDFSKMEAGKLRLQPRPFAPQQLLEDLVARHRLSAESKGLSLRLHTQGLAQCSLLGDPLRIGQIIDNLLANAVKFTPAGSVEVSAQVHIKGECGQLSVRIRDTGCGIPIELQPDIFKPFVQAELGASRRHSGTGLGLSICKRLAEQMHGDLKFTSSPGTGSVFTLQLQLPLSTAAVAVSPTQALRSFEGLRVLVAEDNPINQQVIRRQLGLLDIEPDIVPDGRQAVAATADKPYDLIILDCQMPELDGYQAATQMRRMEATAQTPIIALTAHAMENDMQRALDAGMSDYLTKPVAMATLSDTIARWIDAQT